MLSGKIMIIHFLVGLMRMISLRELSYFPETFDYT